MGIVLITTTGACILKVEDGGLANIRLDVVTTCAESKESICRYIFLSAFWCDAMVTSSLGMSTSGDLPRARRVIGPPYVPRARCVLAQMWFL